VLVPLVGPSSTAALRGFSLLQRRSWCAELRYCGLKSVSSFAPIFLSLIFYQPVPPPAACRPGRWAHGCNPAPLLFTPSSLQASFACDPGWVLNATPQPVLLFDGFLHYSPTSLLFRSVFYDGVPTSTRMTPWRRLLSFLG